MPSAYTVTLTPGALDDLDRLDHFLREKNPSASDRMLNAFTAAFDRLGQNPFGHPLVTTTGLRAKTVRFGQGAYICLYRVLDQTVLVARLFHAREDWNRLT